MLRIGWKMLIITLLGIAKQFLYEDLLRVINIETLEHRRKQQSLILLYKCFNNNGQSK